MGRKGLRKRKMDRNEEEEQVEYTQKTSLAKAVVDV